MSRIPCAPESSEHEGPSWNRLTYIEPQGVFQMTAPKTKAKKAKPPRAIVRSQRKVMLRESIRQLYVSGLGCCAIARELGIADNNVMYYLRAMYHDGTIERRPDARGRAHASV